MVAWLVPVWAAVLALVLSYSLDVRRLHAAATGPLGHIGAALASFGFGWLWVQVVLAFLGTWAWLAVADRRHGPRPAMWTGLVVLLHPVFHPSVGAASGALAIASVAAAYSVIVASLRLHHRGDAERDAPES